MRRMLVWTLVLVLGFAAMLLGHRWQESQIDPTSWTTGLMFIGTGQPGPGADEFDCVRARIRPLPASELEKAIEKSQGGRRRRRRTYKLRLPENFIRLPELETHLGGDLLASGRLPAAGADEVLAGAQTRRRGDVVLGGRRFRIVGVLRREVVMLAFSYVLGESPAHSDLFEDARAAYILRLDEDRLKDKQLRAKVRKAFWRDEPDSRPATAPAALRAASSAAARDAEPVRFVAARGLMRLPPGPYYLYLAGMAMLLLGGSGVLIGSSSVWPST